MPRILFSTSNRANARLQCVDCRTVTTHADFPYCGACGGQLRSRGNSSLPYDAIAALIGVAVVLLYWIARN